MSKTSKQIVQEFSLRNIGKNSYGEQLRANNYKGAMNFATYVCLLRYSIVKKGALTAYKNAMARQQLPASKLHEITWEKTLRLLEYAYDNVPWYTKRFKTIGLHPKDIARPEHFNQVPIVTRDDLMNNFDHFISTKVNPLSVKVSYTRGSSGEPLKVGMGKFGSGQIRKWQMYSWWGLNPWDNVALLQRGVPRTGWEKFIFNVMGWPKKAIWLDPNQINGKGIQDFIKKCGRIRPKLIHGDVGALDAVADFIIDNNLKFPPPKVIWATGAALTRSQEDKMNAAFGAPVCGHYGCSEINFVAAECPSKIGLHVFSDSVNLEILDEFDMPVKKGNYGRIILTNLDEYHFPLIRYENGDIGRWLPARCKSGIGLPLLDRVKGRISDGIVLPDGTVLASEFLTTLFDDFTDSVKQFQILQRKSGSILVNIVLKENHIGMEKIEAIARHRLQRRIKNQVRLLIRNVGGIKSYGERAGFIVKE